MSRPAPTTPAEVPDPEEIEATAGPRETALFDAQGRLTTLPTIWWAKWDRQYSDPRQALVASFYERLEERGCIDSAEPHIESL